jgi:hypothetical protein
MCCQSPGRPPSLRGRRARAAVTQALIAWSVRPLHHTGILFRYVDASNYLYVYTSGAIASSTVTARKVVAGVDSALGSPTAAPSAWATLRVTTSGNTITVYCDSTQLFQVSDSANNAGVGAGLFSQSASTARRWDNFTVI